MVRLSLIPGPASEFTVQATEQPKQLILFIGGWKSQAKLEVFDKSADTDRMDSLYLWR